MRYTSFLSLLSLLAVSLAPLAVAQGTTEPNPANSEWIEATLVIEQPDLRTLDIVGTLVLRKYEVEGTQYDTADDIGDAYQQLLQADEFARQNGQESARAENFAKDMEDNATKALRETLERNFPGATITVDPASLDRSTLEPPSGNPYEPGVLLEIAARVERTSEAVGLGDYSDAAVGVVFDAGARVTSSLTLSASPGHDVLYAIQPPAAPAGLAFVAAGPAGVARLDGATLVVEIDNAAGTTPRSETATATVAKPTARAYSPEEVAAGSSVSATVDLQDIDISIGKAIGGDMGNLVGAVTVSAEMGVFELPDEVKASLPESVELSILTANTIRLLKQHGAISQENLDELENSFRTQLQEKLQGALQVPITVEGGLVESTLDPAGANGDEPGAPIELTASASFLKPLTPGAAPPATAAIAVYTQVQEFDMPGVEGFQTTYKVILPPGLALGSIDVTGGNKASGTEGGRDWFTVEPTSENAHATAALTVTLGFVVAKFWPVLLLAVLVIFLLVGTPIALVVMRRRKQQQQQQQE